ncbi:UvrD-helicase domain-containing protein [Paenibacillus lautus]|uniref:UvrD-helicase domain-containing protein n=1 Tax=Paenibacillus lautus TaxID=1401 RepID=UPI003D9A19B5
MNRMWIPTMKCLEGLNPQQLEAVRFFDRNSMVFAGPGTGKTRVITSRIAYMLESGRLPEAKRVLAITFTNKAANEMSSSVASFGVNQKRVRIGTFHNFCMWVLKAYGDKIKMSRDFTFLTPNQQLQHVHQTLHLLMIYMVTAVH